MRCDGCGGGGVGCSHHGGVKKPEKVKCRDGTFSNAGGKRGACRSNLPFFNQQPKVAHSSQSLCLLPAPLPPASSHHGGVAKKDNRVVCKDKTVQADGGRNGAKSCAKHGGVDKAATDKLHKDDANKPTPPAVTPNTGTGTQWARRMGGEEAEAGCCVSLTYLSLLCAVVRCCRWCWSHWNRRCRSRRLRQCRPVHPAGGAVRSHQPTHRRRRR
jgi:hypothetical protein